MERRDATIYSNNSLLLIGSKFKGQPLHSVPGWYLLWLQKQVVSDLGLREWLDINIEVFQWEKDNKIEPAAVDMEKVYERRRQIRKQFRAKPMTTREGDII